MATSIRTVSQLRAQILLNPTLREELAKDPEATLARVDIAPLPDTGVYKIVVGSLGLVVVLAVIGAVVLSALGKPIPELLLALGSAAIGALAGLLAPSPANSA